MNLVLWCGVSSFCHSAACRIIRVAPAVVTGPPGPISISFLLHWPTRPCQCLLHWPARPCQCLMPPALAHQALSVSGASCTGPPGLVSVWCLLHWPSRPCQCLVPPALALQAMSVSGASCTGLPGLVSESCLLHQPTRPCQCLVPPGQRR